MSFLLAFVVGGLLAAVAQFIFMLSRIEIPKLLIIAFAIGAVLSAIGICDTLGNIGAGGFMITLIGAAKAIYESVMALFEGAWMPLCIVTTIFAALTLLGVLGGMLRMQIEEHDEARSAKK